MPRLAGKVAFITGAGTGIGRATAILFAREGAKVAIAEIDAQAGDETAHLAGNEAIAIRADVTDPDSLQSAIRATVDKFGRLEVLHNNAGGSTAQDDTAVNAPLDEFWRAIKLDLYGTFLGCRFGIPELIKAGGGSVINMSSNVALMGGRWPRLLHRCKGWDRRNYPFARGRLLPAKSSRQRDCAIGDDDRARQETGRRKRRANPTCGLPSARPDRARRHREHGALSRQ
jgi:NAD(P)-dependent dehydrogenase (short-subunit alcohol dehydrogenase family)